MRHFSCDHCGKDLTEPTEARYVLRMESYAITPSEPLTESALDTDHAELLADVLENIPSESHRFLQDQDREPREYDLCPSCFHRFRADPFGQENAQKLHFSSN